MSGQISEAQKVAIVAEFRKVPALANFAAKMEALPLDLWPDFYRALFQRHPHLRECFPRLSEMFP